MLNTNTVFPAQHQETQPGLESLMIPSPLYDNPHYSGSGKLTGKIAFITGGDSGIGRAVACAFAKEGAKVAIAYLDEHSDAETTRQAIENSGSTALLFSGDLGYEAQCEQTIEQVVKTWGRIDVLVNNIAEQHVVPDLTNLSSQQLERVFRTNVYSYFYLTKAALPHMRPGSAIINTASVTAYEGHEQLMDYASTKGAIIAFTRSLAKNLVKRGIRVNAVAPGPVWTPLIPASFNEAHIIQFGQDTPMKRAAQPYEVAPSYVFLAAADSSFMTGQVLHINGGTQVNG